MRMGTSTGTGSRRWSRSQWLWTAGGVGALLIGLALLSAAGAFDVTDSYEQSRREPAPAFELSRLDDPDRTISLAQYRGTPVVVNFFASWCTPCRKEMPDFQSVSEEFRSDVAFIGVNHADIRGRARSLVEETGIRYPSGFDPNGTVATAYGLRGMPSTVFVSSSGILLQRQTGELSAVELRNRITALFGVAAERRR